MPRAWREFAEDDFAENGNAIAPVQRNCTDVEDTSDGRVGSKSDQIDDNAPEHGDPDGVDGSPSPSVDDGPDPGAWNEAIARERKNCTSERLLE